MGERISNAKPAEGKEPAAQRDGVQECQLKSSLLDELFEMNTLLCYLGLIFIFTSFFSCLFGPLLSVRSGHSVFEAVLVSAALLVGMLASFLFLGSKRGTEGFGVFAKKPSAVLMVTACALLLPLASCISVNTGLVPYPALVACAVLTGAALAFFYVSWQMLSWSLSIWSFVRFLGVTLSCSLFLFVLIHLTLIVAYQFVLVCFLIVVSAVVYFTISGGRRADYVIVRESASRSFSFVKEVDLVYMLLHAVGGVATVLLVVFYGAHFLLAPLLAAVVLICLLVLTREKQAYHGAFLLREMRLYIAIQIFSLVLLMVPVDAVRTAALSIIVASWLTLEAFQGAFLERFLGFGPLSVYYICVSGFNMNGSYLVGLIAGAAAVVFLPGMDTTFLVFLVAASALILIDAQFLPYEKDLDFEGEDAAAEGEEAEDDVRAGSVTQLINQRSEEIIATYQLSKREGEVLRILARGSSAKHIANSLGISEHTARVHVYHIYEKTGVHSRQALIDLFDEKR